MIRTYSLRLTLALTVMTAAGAGAQQSTLPSAATLVAKYATAIGGPAMMRAAQITTRGGLQMPMAGFTATYEMVQLAPNKMQMVTTIPGVGSIQVGYDGTMAWSVDPMQGPRLLAGKELDEIREEADPRAMARVPELFASLQTVADTTMGGQQCYLVKLTWKSGRETYDCYNASSGLMVGSKSIQQTPMGAIPVSVEYSDYKKFGDFTVPTKSVHSMMGQQQVHTVTAVEVGTGAGVAISAPAEVKALAKPAGK